MSAYLAPRVSSRAAFYSPAAAHPDFVCGDDAGDGSVSSYAAAQRDAWLAVARRLQSVPRTRYGRGYRIAISRAGVWGRRAAIRG